jgi:hypothetical protein
VHVAPGLAHIDEQLVLADHPCTVAVGDHVDGPDPDHAREVLAANPYRFARQLAEIDPTHRLKPEEASLLLDQH